ncbi:ABC transporter substrate-binding protein [Sporolactobacillus shoreae]|nr:ABC transporter substrate-binding protein [Sporolactobacillus shoreae]
MKKSTLKKIVTGVSGIVVFTMLLTGCFSSSANSNSSTQNGSSTHPRVVIMVGGLEKIIYMPFMLAQQLGYYQQAGVNVSLVEESAGQDAELALLAGQVDGAGGFYDHTLDLATKGKNVEAVVTMADVPGETLLVSDKLKNKVKSISDLKGLKIGVTGLGSSTNMLATYNVVKGGGKENDYTPIPVGAGSTLIAAMKNNKIDAAVTSEPTATMLENSHLAYPLVDMNHKDSSNKALGGGYASTSLYMQNSYVKAHPDVVQKLVNAYVKTLKWMSTHTPEEIAAKMPTDYYAGNKSLYIQALKGQLPMFTHDGKMPASVPENVQKILSSFKPDVKNIDLSKTYTNQFVNKANQ